MNSSVDMLMPPAQISDTGHDVGMLGIVNKMLQIILSGIIYRVFRYLQQNYNFFYMHGYRRSSQTLNYTLRYYLCTRIYNQKCTIPVFIVRTQLVLSNDTTTHVSLEVLCIRTLHKENQYSMRTARVVIFNLRSPYIQLKTNSLPPSQPAFCKTPGFSPVKIRTTPTCPYSALSVD